MKVFRALRQALLTLTVSLVAASVFAQATATQTKPFEPTVGQPGKDVVWVPTPQALVDKMLDMAKLTAQDIHYDLGSGDGRTVITAAKRGATSFGIEYNPDMVALSQKNAAAAGVTDKATFMKADLFETDFSKANVLTLFLLPDINLKLRPKILDMRPGTRVVSNSFTMGEWEADETAQVTEGCTSWCTALMWIVPAKVNGTWKTPQGEMTLNQTFQMVTGTVRGANGAQPITNGRLRGEEIRFTVGGQEYTGRVSGNTMSGTISGGGQWSATR
jgi:precorrin-6B methylase 2